MKYTITILTPINIESRTISEPLKLLERQNVSRVNWLEYHFVKQAAWILRGKEKSPLSRVFKNIVGVMELFLSRGKTLIIGAEPYSEMAFFLNRLKARHRCLFWSSWPFWDDETFPNNIRIPFQKKIWRKFLKDIPCVCATKLVCSGVSSYGGKAFHIPFSVDTEVFRPKASKPYSETVKVLFVGEFEELKGIHLIINIIKKYKLEKTEFWFVGRGHYEEEIRKLQERNYPVRYFGQIRSRRELAIVFQDADILIFPSIRIGGIEDKFGIVLLEALACRLPVIASDGIGPKQIIENGNTGIIIPQNDEKALWDAIYKLIKLPVLRAKLGENGRKRVESFYGLKVVTNKWRDLIKEVHQA